MFSKPDPHSNPTHTTDKPVLLDVIKASGLMKAERKLTSMSLVLVLVHDLLLAKGIQSGDGPIKQAILRHKTRLHGEFQKLKIKRGAASTSDLAKMADERSGQQTGFTHLNMPELNIRQPLYLAMSE